MLRPSSKIAVVAPAGIPKAEGIEAGTALLREWGYRPVLGKHIQKRHFFTAGTAAERTEDLVWALTDPEIDAVWMARGGYGCVHCLKALDSVTLPDRPLIGFSDITALFCALENKGNTQLVHGPMVETLATRLTDATRERIRSVLTGEPMAPLAGAHLCGPKISVSGPLVGGNLCVLASLIGTPWALRARDAIVVLEDVDEAAYRIDRFIEQLRHSGSLDGAKGVVLGEFFLCKVPEGASYTIEDVLKEALSPLGIPVLSGVPIGHGRTNLAFRHGQVARIEDDALWFDSAPAT